MSSEKFDKAAASWDAKPIRVRLAHAISAAIISKLPLNTNMIALEYGCGTGLVSLEVASKVGTIYGLDSSTGMIDVLNEKIYHHEVENMVPFVGEFTDLTIPSFDLIIISMTLHHIVDYPKLLTQFCTRLKPGGFLAIADLEEEDGTFHDDNDGIAHFGFNLASLNQQLSQLGLNEINKNAIFTVGKNNKNYPIFLLTARKPF